MASCKSPASCSIVVYNLLESVTADVIRGVLLSKDIRTTTIVLEETTDNPGYYTARVELLNDSDARKAVSALDGTKIFGETVSARRFDRDSPLGRREQSAATVSLSTVEHFESPLALPFKALSPSIKVTGFASNITEAKLRQHFSSVGTIVSCKLMEKPKSSKPYAYINFRDVTCAKRAVETLHMSEINGSIIKVKLQGTEPVNGTAIKVSRLPPIVTELDLKALCHTFGNILSVKVINTQVPHAFVTFSNPDEALNAAMSLEHQKFKGTTIKVTVVSQQGATLKISGLPPNVVESDVRVGFAMCGNIIGIKVNYTPPLPHAFVTFSKASEAMAATDHFRQQGFIFKSVRIKISPAPSRGINLTTPWPSNVPQGLNSHLSETMEDSVPVQTSVPVSGMDGVPDHMILRESDFIDVMEEVISLCSKWRVLGMALRLSTVELDSIAEKHKSDSMQCLRSVLLSWLLQHYDTRKYGEPTWKVLCRAIEGRAGADEPTLAKEIASRHC